MKLDLPLFRVERGGGREGGGGGGGGGEEEASGECWLNREEKVLAAEWKRRGVWGMLWGFFLIGWGFFLVGRIQCVVKLCESWLPWKHVMW